jgi:hypothetical protein
MMLRDSPSERFQTRMEVADPVPGGQIFRLARRACERRAEEGVYVLRKWPDELGKGTIVEKGERPRLAHRSLFARPGCRDQRVLPHGTAKLRSRANEREP